MKYIIIALVTIGTPQLLRSQSTASLHCNCFLNNLFSPYMQEKWKADTSGCYFYRYSMKGTVQLYVRKYLRDKLYLTNKIDSDCLFSCLGIPDTTYVTRRNDGRVTTSYIYRVMCRNESEYYDLYANRHTMEVDFTFEDNQLQQFGYIER